MGLVRWERDDMQLDDTHRVYRQIRLAGVLTLCPWSQNPKWHYLALARASALHPPARSLGSSGIILSAEF
jgi:hypothetical protein